jgi:hypothetical protein
MAVDLVSSEAQNKKSKIVGGTGGPDGPKKHGRPKGAKNKRKDAINNPMPNFQEGGSSSSTAIVEIPPPVNVATIVKQIEARPKAPPPKPAAKQLGAAPPPKPAAKQLGAAPPPKPAATQLGARSKTIPPTRPTAKQLGASSKSTPRTKPAAEQLGARSKNANPPRERSRPARRRQPGVVIE